MNPYYQQMVSGYQPQAPRVPTFQNPMQKMNYIMQAMRNPAAFIKQQFPDIPDQIANNPGQILSYLQQTRGITDQQVAQVRSMYGGV